MSQNKVTPVKVARIAHIVLFVKDPEASAQWYCDILGMQISARAGDGPYKGGFFLSFGESDHDIALFKAEEGAPKGKEFEHIGLHLASVSMDDLRRDYAFFLERGVNIVEILDHGVSIGIYFHDPDGHMLEIFCQQIAQSGGKARAELKANEGKADPIELSPLSD